MPRESAKHIAEDQFQATVFDALSILERAVVERFYGLLDGSEAMSIAEISTELRITPAAVRRARSTALLKLKRSETVKHAAQQMAPPRRGLIA